MLLICVGILVIYDYVKILSKGIMYIDYVNVMKSIVRIWHFIYDVISFEWHLDLSDL